MSDETQKVICLECGKRVEKSKFCSECGALLEKPKPSVQKPAVKMPGSQSRPVYVRPVYVSDKGLTMLADYCRKTLATVGGDGYSEAVLYRNDKTGEYQLHTYSRFQPSNEEIHEAYSVDTAFYNAVFALIRKHNLAQYEGKKSIAPRTGAEVVCKFLEGGKVIRITDANVSYPKGSEAMEELGRLLYSGVKKENALLA